MLNTCVTLPKVLAHEWCLCVTQSLLFHSITSWFLPLMFIFWSTPGLLLEYEYTSRPMVFTARGCWRFMGLTESAPLVIMVAPIASTTFEDEGAAIGKRKK